jgi:hypothetical protein
METANLYYQIPKPSTITQDLIDFAHQPETWAEYYNFKARMIPLDIIFKDNFFSWLLPRHNFIGGVLKLDPYICYDWHTDTRRKVGINMLLTPFERSSCLFAPKKEGAVFKIQELKYKPSYYYLFNTQVPHTVYNYDSTRYLMSIEFENDKLSYEDLLNDIRSNYERS